MWRAKVLAVFYHASAPCRKTQDTTVVHDTLPGAFCPLMAGYKCGAHCPASRRFPMSLQYVRHLISSERQWLIRIAKGRCGCRRPAGWKMERIRALLKCDAGSEGEGWTDEAIAAALDVSARRVGRWCRQDADEGPEAVLEPPRPRAAALPTNGTARAKRSSRCGPSPNRPTSGRAGPCACWPRSWKPVRSCPRSATKPCAVR